MPIEKCRSRHRQRTEPYDHGEPLRWLSLVPLAGVFAIAGALIASAYGMTPNAVLVDLPVPYPDDEIGVLTPAVDRLALRANGSILWNGTEVSEAQLAEILDNPGRAEAASALLFTPDADVPYIRALEVLNILRQHGALDRCFRFSGIQKYRKYEDPETFDDLAPYVREDCPPLPPGHSMPGI